MKTIHLANAVPEIPVRDLSAALHYYTRVLCFKSAWHSEAEQLAAVYYDAALLYLRQCQVVAPVTNWIATDDVDACYKRFEQLGALLYSTPADKLWAHRQFELRDPDANRFYFHQKITQDAS